MLEAGTASLDKEVACPEFDAGGAAISGATSWLSSKASFRRLINA
jgi:hypothetical protein